MIKIFMSSEWGQKVNFVDDKNRLVGYSMADDCCAHGGWFIKNEIYQPENVDPFGIPKQPDEHPDLSDYCFDENFQKEISANDFEAIVFRLISESNPDLYLHLFNVHNGYYAKGFECSFGENKSGVV